MGDEKSLHGECMLYIAVCYAEAIAADVPERVRALRISAIREVQKYLTIYQNHGYDQRLIDTIAEKKCKHVIVYLVTSCKKVGPIQQTLNIIRHLDRDRFESVLITLYDEPTDGTSQLDKFIALGVRNMHVSMGKKDVVFGDLSRLKKVLDEIGPVVIHSLGVFPDYAVGRMHYNDRQVMVLRNYMHDDFLSKFGPIQGRALEALQMRAVHRAKKVLTCSRSLSDIYKERKGLAFDYICNGVDVEAYHRVSDEERKKLRIPNPVSPAALAIDMPLVRTKRVVGVGRLAPQKNFRLLIGSFAAIAAAFPGYSLDIYGEGPLRSELQAQIDALGMADRIQLRGAVHDIFKKIADAELFVMSSDYEGFPNALVEAMALGLPIISTDFSTGVARGLIGPENGRVVPVGDDEALARAMEELLADSALRERMASSNREKAKGYGIQAIARQWARVIDGTQ